jgi:dimethylargininase
VWIVFPLLANFYAALPKFFDTIPCVFQTGENLMFSKAIVRRPGMNFSDGITSAGLGKPDVDKAIAQHQSYVAALETCGLQVTVLQADHRFPDGVFVEDVAVLTEKCAILTHPGAPSRQGEEELILPALQPHFGQIHRIQPPGTLDGGDVCQAGNLFFIGISERTNESGALQLASHLSDYGYSSTLIDCRMIHGLLHLKTGLAYLGDQTFAQAPALQGHTAFSKYRLIRVNAQEAYAANSIRVNDHVVIPAGFPAYEASLKKAGFTTIAVEMSEFQKMDGGLSCLSLRF